MGDSRGIYTILFIIALFVLGGFFLIFDTMSDMRNDFRDLELSVERLLHGGNVTEGETPSPSEEASQTEEPEEETPEPVAAADRGVVIPTAVLFETTSSPALLPRTRLSITLENVSKNSEGVVVVNFKVYTSKATGYTALSIKDIFQVIFLGGENREPSKITGSFNSIPPKSVISGSAEFVLDPETTTVLLQTGLLENARFYSFDFVRKTYKETPLG